MSEDKIERPDRREKDKRADLEVNVDNKFLKWVENFWFYHKWHIIAGVFALVVVYLVISQIIVRDKKDITILCAGPYAMTSSLNINMTNAFNAAMPYDFNGDGNKDAGMAHVEVYSKDQIEEFIKDYKSENQESPVVNSMLNADNLKNFNNLIMAGEYSVCIIDSWLYEDAMKAGAFRPLSEIFPEGVPAIAIDEYAIKFSETEFAKKFACFSDFPEDTVICLRKQGVINGIFNSGKAEKEYAKSVEMFKALIRYSPEK